MLNEYSKNSEIQYEIEIIINLWTEERHASTYLLNIYMLNKDQRNN